MVSAMVSRAFVFGLEIIEAQLEINNRRESKQYVATEAAAYLYGHPNKSKLTESPFIRYLGYGQGKYGY